MSRSVTEDADRWRTRGRSCPARRCSDLSLGALLLLVSQLPLSAGQRSLDHREHSAHMVHTLLGEL